MSFSRLEAVLLPGPFLVRSCEELHPCEWGPRDLKALEGPAPPVFSVTEAHVVLSPLLSLSREGQETGLAAYPGTVERDPPNPGRPLGCLLRVLRSLMFRFRPFL